MAEKLPNYSVLMSVYYKEHADYLKVSIDSIWNQTVKTNDFVLVCDGPLNGELESVINDAKRSLGEALHVVRLEKNSGLGEALNIGIRECKNEIVARMDSDDIAFPDRCERQLRRMITNNLDMISGSVLEFQDNIENITGTRRVPATKSEIIQFSRKRNPFNHPAIMYNKASVIEAGGYTEDFHLFEDYHLWIRMLMRDCNCENLLDPVVYMRTGSDAILRRGGKDYAKDMLKFHRWLKQIGWISQIDYVMGALPHSTVCYLPNRLRIIVYNWLRKQ